ncbi:MAG: hypothetical protein D6757_03890 [Alphaproteobacteria bacterium]|nr:MAG: hypothetical protein D6757_03890 [Alphaproteobacteria bacterium]
MSPKRFLLLLLFSPCLLTPAIGTAAAGEGIETRPAPAHLARIVPDVSHDLVELRYDFTGTELLIFGAMSPPASADVPIDLVIAVEGPRRSALLRRKQRIAGIWVNRLIARIDKAPGFYALRATRPLAEIAPESVWRKLAIGIGHLPMRASLADGRVVRLAPEARAGFFAALAMNGLYRTRTGPSALTIKDGALFRTHLALPSKLPEGDYRARVLLFEAGKVMAERTLALKVRKAGFERAIFRFAHRLPLAYGIVAVAFALLAGWGAGRIFRRR